MICGLELAADDREKFSILLSYFATISFLKSLDFVCFLTDLCTPFQRSLKT